MAIVPAFRTCTECGQKTPTIPALVAMILEW